ncbi:MAG: hypothetical protein ABR552_06070 [Actinomycetota bacterium]
MASARDDYIRPVGFATEPHLQRQRWVGRIFLVLLVIFIGWLLVYRVVSPSDNGNTPSNQRSTLPAPG